MSSLPARSQTPDLRQYCEQSPACDETVQCHLVKMLLYFPLSHDLTSPPCPPVLQHPSLGHPGHQAQRVLKSSNSLPTANHIKESLPAAARRVGVQSARWIKPLEMHVIQVLNWSCWIFQGFFRPVPSPPSPGGYEEGNAPQPTLIQGLFRSSQWAGSEMF